MQGLVHRPRQGFLRYPFQEGCHRPRVPYVSGEVEETNTSCIGSFVCARRRAVTAAASSDDEVPPKVTGDWRAFRAGLLSQSGQGEDRNSLACEANVALLREQDPSLADEPFWAHPIDQPEVGSVLLASLKAPEVLNDPRLWQLVVLVIFSDERGATGIILNRPSMAYVGDMFQMRAGATSTASAREEPGVLREELLECALAFKENVLYLGGMFGPNKLWQQGIMMLSQHEDLPTSVQLVPGVYIGGPVDGAAAIRRGEMNANACRFFCGVMAWGPGQLRLEIDSGLWHPVACSRNLVIKQCLKLPTPLWQEIMQLLGGEYAAMAEQARKQA